MTPQNNTIKILVCKDSKVCLPEDTYKIFIVDQILKRTKKVANLKYSVFADFRFALV